MDEISDLTLFNNNVMLGYNVQITWQTMMKFNNDCIQLILTQYLNKPECQRNWQDLIKLQLNTV